MHKSSGLQLFLTLVLLSLAAPAARAHGKPHKLAKHAPAKAHAKPEKKAGAGAEKAEQPDKAAAAEKPEAVEAVEEVEAVDPVDPAVNGSAQPSHEAPLSWIDVVSRLHPAMVHMPIAWLLLLLFTDVLTFVGGRGELRHAGLYLACMAVLSFAPAIVTGLLRMAHLPQDPEALQPAVVHRNMMYVTCGLAALACALRLGRDNILTGVWRWGYLALVSAGVMLSGYGAHLGGKLVYGDDYLPF